MVKAKFIHRVASFILAGLLSLGGAATAASSAAGQQSAGRLPEPAWTAALKSPLDGYTEAPYHVPNSNTVYLPSYTLVNSGTKSWAVGVVTAVDKTTGKQKWSFSFYKKGSPYPWTTSNYAYGKTGSVYALVTDGTGTKLYSVSAAGKSNWTVKVPDADEVYAMNDGTLLLVDPDKRNAAGKLTPWAYAYSASGVKISDRSISENYAVLGDRYLVSLSGEPSKPKLEAYGPKLNRLFAYSLPNGAYTDVAGGAWLFDNANILLRMNVPKTGNKLVALNAQGKALWERNIARNAAVQALGSTYALYANGELGLYGNAGLIRKKALEIDEPMPTLLQAPDRRIVVRSAEGWSVIDPATLEPIYHFPSDQKLLTYHYAGDGYLYAVSDAYRLTQYRLAKA